MIIKRYIQQKIENHLFKGKVIILYGARQVGKTTIIKELQKKYPDSVYLNCDEPDIRARLQGASSTALGALIGKSKLVLIDEAQRVEDIGLTLKLMVDNFPNVQVIATGSSSFDLSNKIAEPLTGRAYEFMLYPLAVSELRQQYSELELQRLLERRLLYGMYPEIVEREGEVSEELKNIARSYAYKDILQYQGIRNPEVLEKLLTALALQIGNEVSYVELARLVGVNRLTVESYISILEKAFIIFRLRPYSRNPRKELAKLRKVYFYDVGIRNALINNFNPLSQRADVGALWENFWVVERIKYNQAVDSSANMFFWRTYAKQEIDLVEEAGGRLAAFECKWSPTKKVGAPSEWRKLYKESPFTVITPENFLGML